MSEDLAQKAFDRALALCDLGRAGDAEAALREALREDPDDPVAHLILALVLLDLDRPDEALESASTTIALEPDLALGHVARAQALLALGRFDDVEAAAYEAIRIDPEDADPWVLLAAASLGRNRWDDAIAAAHRAQALEPDSETARGVEAVALAMSGGADWQEAARDTLALSPGSSYAHSLSGLAHLMGGNEREAAERFREALRLDPESELAQASLADAMKAAHPLYRPFFRFFVWQSRLSRGWRIAIVVGPLIVVRALRPAAAHEPLVWVLIGLWLAFVLATWLAVPIANAALRFSAVGRAVLPGDQKFSSSLFLVFIGAALVALVLSFAVQGAWVASVFALVLLGVAVGSAHDVPPRLRRIVYAVATAAGVAAFVGGALLSVRVSSGSVGAMIMVAAMVTGGVLIWVVRLG